MAKKENNEETSGNGGKRGRKALPPDPREAALVLIPTRVVKVLDALDSLGAVSRSTCPNPNGEGRVRVEYDTKTDVDSMEAAIMAKCEEVFHELRNRPPAASSGNVFKL